MKKTTLLLIVPLLLLSGCTTSLIMVNIDSNVTTTETKTTNGIDALNF